MLPMGTNTDAWIASIASYVRASFGNAGGMVTPADVGARARRDGQPQDSLDAQGARSRRCRVDIEAQAAWKLTASHNAETRAGRAHDESLDDGRAAGARHVVPGRAAAAGAC